MDIYNMWFSLFLLLHILASVLHGLLHTAGRVDGHDRPRQLRPQLHPLLLDVPPIQVVAAFSRSDKMIDRQGNWTEDLWSAIEASEPVANPAADSTNPRPTWSTNPNPNPTNQLTTRATGRKIFGLPSKPQNQLQAQQQIPRTHVLPGTPGVLGAPGLPGAPIPQTSSPPQQPNNQDQNNPKKQ